MEHFKRYIKERGHGIPASESELRALLRAHPWFSTARLVQRGVQGARYAVHATRCTENEDDKITDTDQVVENVMPDLPSVDREPWSVNPDQVALEDRIIEQFLAGGEYRIVPGDADPEASVVETEQGLVSEALARIYFDQELWEQARAAYEKLSLAYPEKSAYFATLIADIDVRSSAEAHNESPK